MRCNKFIFANISLRKIFSAQFSRVISISMGAVITLLLAACGGGGGGGGDNVLVSDSTPSATNVQAVTVTGGPNNGVNLLLTSVKICTPGSSSQCQTIDNILVDTGSYGLRVMSSVLNGGATPSAVFSGNNRQLIECTQFADGFTWGPVKRVDIRIAGEVAANVPIQIIGDPSFSVIPANCSNSGTDHSSVTSFGANGVLGIGVFSEDCGPLCTVSTNNNQYYDCLSGNCANATSVLASLAMQVRNPIDSFAVNNNGVVIDLPTVPDQGAATVAGSMIFGIGTQTNNALGNARIIDVNPNSGTFTTTAPNQTFSNSFIDSGSNGLFFPTGAAFPANSLPTCGPNTSAPEFFCPNSQLTFSTTLLGFSNGANAAVSFNIGNAVNLLNNNPSFHAYSNLGAPIPPSLATSFDWGLPFHFGRRVYTALSGANAGGTVGPYIAF